MTQTFLSPVVLAVFASGVLIAQTPEGPVVVIPKPEPAKWLELEGQFPLTRLSVPGGKEAKWELIDTTNAELEICESGKKASLVVSKEGRYRLLVSSESGTFRIAVTVGKPVPLPPDVPPTPVDPLIGKLQAAYTADTGTAKVAELKVLTALYSGAVDLVSGTTPPASVSDLLARLRSSATALGVVNLNGLRKVIADELKAVFPTDAPWDATTASKAVAVLTRIRDGLKAVK